MSDARMANVPDNPYKTGMEWGNPSPPVARGKSSAIEGYQTSAK